MPGSRFRRCGKGRNLAPMKIDLAPVINLLHRADSATLATQSLGMPGYPYATAVPNILDERHRPVLLISALAEHTRNLMADPRVSLSVSEPGSSDIQNAARLTLIGDVERLESDDCPTDRYLRYLPAAAQYLQLDFNFFRIVPKRIRYIGGVGRMGWIEGDAYPAAACLSATDESALLQQAQALTPGNVTLLGIDPFGIDHLADGCRKRFEFGAGDYSRDAILERVARLA